MSKDNFPKYSDAEVALRERIETLPRIKASKRGVPRALSQTGEEYTEFRHVNGSSEADALRQIEADIFKYAVDRAGTLYWRIWPEAIGKLKGNFWGAYARLLISEKPEIYDDEGNPL